MKGLESRSGSGLFFAIFFCGRKNVGARDNRRSPHLRSDGFQTTCHNQFGDYPTRVDEGRLHL